MKPIVPFGMMLIIKSLIYQRYLKWIMFIYEMRMKNNEYFRF